MSAGPAATRAARLSPYKGLVPYSAEDASFFFGRERERDVVIANLRARHLTVVYGESGVGKSSLLHAGVLSELRTQARDDMEDRETPEFIPVLFSSWRDDPLAGLLDAVRSSVAEILPARALGPAHEKGLPETLDAWAHEVDCEFLIILDQFEEYFLYHGREEGEGTFDLEFPRALNRSRLGASFLLAIREDAFAKLDRFKTRVPGLLDNYLRIRHLDETAARLAIRLPLEAWNTSVAEGERIEIDAALVQAVIDEVESGIARAEQAGQGVIEHDGRETAGERVEAPYLQLVMTRLWDEEIREGSRRLRVQTLERLGGAERIVQNHLDEAMSELPAAERELAADAFYYLVTPEGTKIAQSVETLAAYSRHSADELERVLEKLTTGGVRILRPVAPAPGSRGGTRYEIFHDVLAAAILDWRTRMERVKLERERQEAEHKREEAQKQTRIQRQRAQRFRALAVLFGVLFAGGLVLWGIGQQRDADRERAVRKSRELAQSAVIRIPSDPELSLLLAREALKVRHTPEAEEAFRESLMASHVRVAYRGHRSTVNTVAFSSDGRLVVTGSDDRTARVWETSTGRTKKVLRGHTDYVTSAAFSPDGKQVVTAGWDRTARLWNVSTGRNVRTLRGHRARLQSAAFSPDGRLIVTAGTDRTVRIWATATGRGRVVLHGHTGSVNTAAFSPDGSLIVSSSDDGTARIWQVATGRIVRVLRGHTDFVASAEFSQDGRRVVTGSSDETARIWNVRTGRTIATLRGQGDVITGASFSPDGTRILTTGLDQAARIWDVSSNHTILVLRGHSGPVNGAAFSPDGGLVATGSLDHTARLWSVPPPIPRLRHPVHVNSASFRADGKSIVTASDDGKARLWDVSKRRRTAVLRATAGRLFDAAYSPDGRSVITAGERGAGLIDVGTGLVERRFNAPGPLFSAAFSPDGNAVALAGASRSVRIFDPATALQEGVLPAGEAKETVTRAVFSPDGERIATSNTDGVARVFDAATGRATGVLRERAQLSGQIPLYDAEFSPDGKFLITAGDFGAVKLWDLKKLVSVTILAGLSGPTYSAAFTPDGKRIVTAGQDGRVDLWDRATARRVGMLERHDGAVVRAAVSPDGKRVVTAGEDGTARIVPCEVCAPIDHLLRLVPGRVTRELSDHERDLYVR